ncbi:MAG: SMI1/KNR4 family protein, partial [Anaerolineales bacterium]
FVSKYGCVAMGSNELYGICGNNSSIPSAIHATRSARKGSNFPRHLVVIGDDGSGRKFCVDSNDEIFEWQRNRCVPTGEFFASFAVKWLGA